MPSAAPQRRAARLGDALKETHELWDLEAFGREVKRRKVIEHLLSKIYFHGRDDLLWALHPRDVFRFAYSRVADGYPYDFRVGGAHPYHYLHDGEDRIASALRQALSHRFKHAFDDFSLTYAVTTRDHDTTDVQGHFHVYAIGDFQFHAELRNGTVHAMRIEPWAETTAEVG